MNLSKELLNLSVGKVVVLSCGVGLNKLCHVHILNKSGDGVGLGGRNTSTRCNYLFLCNCKLGTFPLL